MRNSLLRQKLYDRVSEELEAFKAELLDKSPQDIMENAYAIVIREDIVSEIECGGQYSDEQYKALLRLKYPLDTLYNEWMDTDCSQMEMIREVVYDFSKEEAENQCSGSPRAGVPSENGLLTCWHLASP